VQNKRSMSAHDIAVGFRANDGACALIHRAYSGNSRANPQADSSISASSSAWSTNGHRSPNSKRPPQCRMTSPHAGVPVSQTIPFRTITARGPLRSWRRTSSLRTSRTVTGSMQAEVTCCLPLFPIRHRSRSTTMSRQPSLRRQVRHRCRNVAIVCVLMTLIVRLAEVVEQIQRFDFIALTDGL